MSRLSNALLCAFFCVFALPALASGKNADPHPTHLPSKARSDLQATAASAAVLHVFACRTQSEFESHACVEPSLAQQFDASAFDYLIGGYTDFDYQVQEYNFRFTAPDGVVTQRKWTLKPDTFAECPGGYYNVYADGLTIWQTCYLGYDGVYQGLAPKRKAGLWKIELLEDGVMAWTAYATLKEAEIQKTFGDGQSGLVLQPLRAAPRYSLRHYDGELVDIAESDSGQRTLVDFTISGPGGAGGMSVSSDYYPDGGQSQSLSVTLGSKAGTYTVSGTLAGAKMPSPFAFTAVTRLEPEDNKDKEEGNGENECTVADPVSIGIGNSFQQDVDYARTGLSPLEFVRSYNALGSKSRLMRNYWTTTFDRAVLPPTIAGNGARVRRPDGRVIAFVLQNGIYTPARPYFHGTLRASGSGWQYVTEDNVTETYDAQGRWTTIVDAVGLALTAQYNSQGLLTKVTANTGESLTFSYNAYLQVESVTDHSNRQWVYAYNGFANLTQVREPDGVYRTYHYEDINNPYLLTGVSAGRNATPALEDRYVTWEFDALGRATANYFTNGLQRFDIAYNDVDDTRVVTDALGHASVYQTRTLNGRGFVDGIVGPGFASCGFADAVVERDPDMNVVSSTAFGRVTQFGNYDTKGQYGVVIEAAGKPGARRTDYVYDARFIGRPTTITEPSVASGRSKVTQIGYDDAGNVIQQLVTGYRPDGTPVSRNLTLQYAGPYGQLSRIDGPRTDVQDVTQFEYHPTTNRLLRVVDSNGIVLRDNIAYTATGQLAAEDRPNGLRVTYSYHPGTDLLKSVAATGASVTRTTTWTYDDRRRVASITFSDGANPDTTTQFTYNAAGDVTSIASPNAGSIVYTYDNAGNRVRDSYQATQQERRWVQRTFDAYGRVKDLINPDNRSITDFHPEGTLTSATDGRSNATSYGYDDFKRLTQTLQPGQLVTTFGYDIQGQLTRVTDANQGSTYQTYDDLGNRLRLESPDTGVSVFEHDAAGNVVGATDALGQSTSYVYDAGNRLLLVDRIDTADDETYTYDSCTNGDGRLCSATNGIGDVVSYEYDPLGRITKQVTNAGAVGYAYDAAGNVTEINYPSQRKVRYAHDTAGQVTTVTVVDGGNTYVLARNVTHLPFGPASSWIYGNGLVESRQYDQQYRPLAFSTGGRSSASYGSYDGNSSPTQRVINGASQALTFDALNRLDTASGAFGSRDYGYDAVGNRTSLEADGLMTAYTHQPQSNRLLSDTQWTYGRDANGNETRRQAADGSGWELTYTANNRLLGVTDLQYPDTVLGIYRYNALGQRTAKSTPYGDTRFVYGLSGELLAESLPDGSVTQEYVYLEGTPIALLGVPAAPATPFALDQIIDNASPDWFPLALCATKRSNVAVNGSLLECSLDSGYGMSWPWAVPASGTYDVSVWWAWRSDYQCYTFTNDSYCVGDGAPSGTWLSLGRHHLVAGEHSPTLVALYNDDRDLDYMRMDAVRYVLVYKDLTDRDYRYVHTDALATPLSLTDKAGTVVWQANYDPFGAATVNDDPDNDGAHQVLNLRFPGQYYDAETGLHYNYFRDYDPSKGGYLQSDPIGLAGGLNTYAYAGGNPVSSIDPYGLLDVYAVRYRGLFAEQNGGDWGFGVKFYSNGRWIAREAGYRVPGAGGPLRGVVTVARGVERIAGKLTGVSNLKEYKMRRQCDAADARAEEIYKELFGDAMQLNEAQLRQFLGAVGDEFPALRNIYDPGVIIQGAIVGARFHE